MNATEKMLAGIMPIQEFSYFFEHDEETKQILEELIPSDARWHPEHPLWKKFSYNALLYADFNLYKYLKYENIYQWDYSLGDNLNIHSTIEYFYLFRHPNTETTAKYHEAYDLFLAVAGDYYEGPEVSELIEKTLMPLLSISQKGKRTKEAKDAVRELFHMEKGSSKPYWIQGAEWPMGDKSPMKYTGSKKVKDGKKYYFQDVDTLAERVVTQYY